jgi:hypothetical protein
VRLSKVLKAICGFTREVVIFGADGHTYDVGMSPVEWWGFGERIRSTA